MKQAGSFFEFKLELAIRMYFLCIDFFGRLPGGCVILTVDSLAKDQSTVSFRVNPATKKATQRLLLWRSPKEVGQ